MRQLILLISFLMAVPCQAFAGPASPDFEKITQPDGSNFLVQTKGDEFAHWTETLDGYTVMQNPASKAWEYALPTAGNTPATQTGMEARKAPPVAAQGMTLSGLQPGRDAPPAESRNLRPESNAAFKTLFDSSLDQTRQDNRAAQAIEQGAGVVLPDQTNPRQGAANPWTNNPTSGTRKMLVVLVNFSDQLLQTTPANWYEKVFSAVDGVKSVVNFYKDNTHGKLTIAPVAHTQYGNSTPGVVMVTLETTPHPNYGGTYTYAQETAWLNAALASAASFVDFASLDTNQDGYITPSEAVIYFIPAGYERSGTTKTPNVWAHAWGDWSAGPHVMAGTKILSNWAMNGELNGFDRQHPIGVICHEMGHQICALPDLYDTSYTNYGLGAFSLMASGSWGADTGEDSGATPVSFDAWSRAYCVWDATRLLRAKNQTVTFGAALSDSTLKILAPSLSTTEYFLVENRPYTGWDKGIRRWDSTFVGGLLILHVDNTIGTPGQGTTGNNDINKYGVGSHQGVVAVQASSLCNLLGTYGTDGTGCPGKQTVLYYQENNAAFTPATTPNSNLYSGTATALGLTGISAVGATMTAQTISPYAMHLNYPLLLQAQ